MLKKIAEAAGQIELLVSVKGPDPDEVKKFFSPQGTPPRKNLGIFYRVSCGSRLGLTRVLAGFLQVTVWV